MNINKLTGYFHDGTILDVQHKDNIIELFLESSQMEPNEEISQKDLSASGTLTGKLCLIGVQNIKIGNTEYKGILQKNFDDGEILTLEVSDHKILILVEWINFPPKVRASAISKIEIQAKKIFWENIPDLINP
jgi:hypothetical protein